MTRGSPGATAMAPVYRGRTRLAVPPVAAGRPAAAVKVKLVLVAGAPITEATMNVPLYRASETLVSTTSSPTDRPCGEAVVTVTVVSNSLTLVMTTGVPCSNSGFQDRPPSLVFQAPPPAVEM